MTIDEAIKHCLEVAEVNEDIADNCDMDNWMNKAGCEECAADHRQLAEWLTELKELREENEKLMSQVCELQLAYNNELVDGRKAKRLLKAAVEGFEFLGAWMDEQGDCTLDCSDCPLHRPGYYCRGWNKQNEALALIGEDGDVE